LARGLSPSGDIKKPGRHKQRLFQEPGWLTAKFDAAISILFDFSASAGLV
jgi:hypothetical protein